MVGEPKQRGGEGQVSACSAKLTKLLAIFLLSEEGTDLTVAKVSFEILPFCPSPHLETRRWLGLVGRVHRPCCCLSAIMWVPLWTSDGL